tara:strand:- start:352 stop:933 length:582 start_codon:yes stop_codon:yes gene_type:complete
MASTIKTNNITGFSGGAGSAPITLSGDTATLSGTGVTFPAGHIIATYTKSFGESISTTSTNHQDFSSSNDLSIGTVEAGVTIWAQIAGGGIFSRYSNKPATGTACRCKIGPTSDFSEYRGGHGDTGGGSTQDMDLMTPGHVIGARYFSSETASVVVRGGYHAFEQYAGWLHHAQGKIIVTAFKIMGDVSLTAV